MLRTASSSPRLRRLARAVLLALPLLLVLGWMIWGEWVQFAQAQRQVEQNAARVAAEAAGRIASRLNTQFTELQFAAVALLGPEADPAHPDPAVVQTLRRFMALHPSLYAFNIQAADGNTILWSTQPQPSQPIAAASHFTALPTHPDFLLGSSQYAARVGTHVLTMRFALRDASGRVRYLVGTPYRIDQLLSLPGVDLARQPWTLTVIDSRNGSVVGQWAQGRMRFPRTAPAADAPSVRQAIAGYPLAVQVNWPFGVVCLTDLHGAAVRWSFELGTLMLLGLAAWWIARLLDQRQQAAARLRRLSTFNALRAEVLHAASQIDTPRTLWDTACHLAVQRAGLSRAWVGGTGDSGGFAVLAAAGDTAGLDAVFSADDTTVAADIGAARQAWSAAQAVFLPAAQTAGPRRPDTAQAAPPAVAALPLREGRAVAAVLTLVGSDIAAWDDETRSVMRDLAVTLEQSLSDLDKRRQVRSLQRLYQALMHEADVLLRARSEPDMLRRTCKALIHKTPFHAAWIGQPDEQSGTVRVLAQAGEGGAELGGLALPLDSADHTPLVVRAWVKQRMVFNNDHLSDAQLAPWKDFLVRHRWHAALAAPVRRAGRPWGVLVFVSPDRGVFDLPTVALCARVAELLGHGLDEFDLRERLAQQQTAEAHRARHDALTGLPNRYALEQYLPQAIARAQRHATGLGVGMIDLDDFKPVNDTHGHAAGDVLLQQLAQRLQTTLRASDFIARLGGDEFVVVFEDLESGQEQAQLPAALQRLHSAVQTPFDLGQGRQGSVGMSLGLALYPGDGDNADTLLRHADAAMYQIKAHKGDRATWWSLQTQSPQDAAAPGSDDAYGAATAAALARTQAQWSTVASRFVSQWYAQMRERPAMRAILDTLEPAALDALQQRQAAHLQFILSPQTSRAAIDQAGQHVGQVHALSGVGAGMLVQMAERYRTVLREQWIAPMTSAAQRDALTAALDTRVLDDLQAQLRGIEQTMEAYFAALARALPQAGHAWAEVVRSELAALATLPGIQAASLLQPDAQRTFQITHSEGPQAQNLLAQLRRPSLQPAADESAERGGSLVAQAWRTRQIVYDGALQKAAGMQPWRDMLVALNLRSAAAIPLVDANGHPDAVLLLDGAYPHQFAAAWMRQFAANLQSRWAQLIGQRQRQTSGLALAAEEAQARRRRLFGGGLAMWMQPVADLRSGKVVRAEALARLQLPFGEVLGPADFLPLLDDQELAQLFQLGLEQTLQALGQWDAQGLRLDVSINLPPSLLLDHAVDIVAAALQRHGVAARRLQLELLENQEADGDLRDACIRRLRQLGVQLAIDDLGSGYSSLLRLKTLPFDAIKVDQGLVSGMAADPLRGLALVRSLLQMGRDLDLAVVVEGLETAGLIEMAAVLGARYGQGYGLARPMPAADLPAWEQTARLPAWQPDTLHTAMGALAYHWQYIHDETCVHPMALEQCPLTAFLQRQGWDELAQAHAQFHAGIDVAGNSARLTLGLVQRVRQGAPEV